MIELHNGDCLQVMRDKIKDNSIDTILTDPPYGLSFMGKKWDYDIPSIDIFKEMLRVLKPGGTLLCFAGTRTQHRMAVNIEDSGFILKDCIMYLYGSGFPKATDISKQIDKSAGKQREVIKNPLAKKQTQSIDTVDYGDYNKVDYITPNPITTQAKLWNGWKSHGLKPAYEPIMVAMKPNEGSYSNNALKYGVSGLNVDGSRIDAKPRKTGTKPDSSKPTGGGHTLIGSSKNKQAEYDNQNKGRYPANIILDEVAGEMLDRQSGNTSSSNAIRKNKKDNKNYPCYGNYKDDYTMGFSDKGGASRFFYCAKASKYERNEGCEDVINNHCTVKPESLMVYLCTLTKTPTGGIVLDPFCGSGTTGIACKITKRPFIGIEMDKEYFKIAEARLKKPVLPKLF